MELKAKISSLRLSMLVLLVALLLIFPWGITMTLVLQISVSSFNSVFAAYAIFLLFSLILILIYGFVRREKKLATSVYMILLAIIFLIASAVFTNVYLIGNIHHLEPGIFGYINYFILFYITTTVFSAIGFLISFQPLMLKIIKAESKYERKLYTLLNQWVSLILFIISIVYFSGYGNLALYIIFVMIFARTSILTVFMLNEITAKYLKKNGEFDRKASNALCFKLTIIALISPLYMPIYSYRKFWRK